MSTLPDPVRSTGAEPGLDLAPLGGALASGVGQPKSLDAAVDRLRRARTTPHPHPDAGLPARAASRALARAYTAANGHLPGTAEELDAEPDPVPARPRIALAPRLSALAAVVVLAIGCGVGGATLLSRGMVAPATLVEAAAEGGVQGAGVEPTPPSNSPATPQATDSSPAEVMVVVHVVGQVARPGVVTLPAGARVAEAVEAVGGATPEADLAAVNLARILVDGEQLRIPAPGESVPDPPPPEPQPAPSAPGAGGEVGGEPAELVNINQADAGQLQQLPGIGPALAARIIAWREANGGFAQIGDLLEVSGIGPAVFSGLAELVSVG